MKGLLLPLLSACLFYGCKNYPETKVDCGECEKQCREHAIADDGMEVAPGPWDCQPRTGTVDTIITNPESVSFCVDVVSKSIGIKVGSNCIQCWRLGDSRQLAVITDANNRKHLIDSPSSKLLFPAYPVIVFPLRSSSANCNLELRMMNGGANCPFVLIGRDDIRNDASPACEEFFFNLSNLTAADGSTKHIRINLVTIQGVDVLLVEHSIDQPNGSPANCPAHAPDRFCRLCKLAIHSTTPCQ